MLQFIKSESQLLSLYNIIDFDSSQYNVHSDSIKRQDAHEYVLYILDQMQYKLLNEKELINWDPDRSVLFIHAVKHHLNNQSNFFDKVLEKYSNNQIPYIIPKRTKKKKQPSLKSQAQKLSHKQKSVKQDIPQQQQKNCTKKQDDQMSDDLNHFNNIHNTTNNAYGMLPASHFKSNDQDNRSVKTKSMRDESDPIFYEDQSEEQDSDQEETLGQFVEKAYTKTNALIYGNFSTRQLRRKPKDDKIELQLSNCFVKMIKNGRDSFFERINLSLFKKERNDIP